MDLSLSRGFAAKLVLLVALTAAGGCVDLKRGEWNFPASRLIGSSILIVPEPAAVQPAVSTPPAEPIPARPAVELAPAEPTANVPNVAPGVARNVVANKAPPSALQFADWNQNHSLRWRTSLGEGGAELPLIARSSRDVPREHQFSRVVGVYFPPDSGDVVFIGTQDPLRPPLDPEFLLDALVVAYRTWWQGEQRGVSIDPPQKSSYSGDQQVRFIGGIGNTDVGFVAFESDRLMKCLSLGGDNETGLPFSSNVPGYQNKFAWARMFPDGSASRHRFWFEPHEPQVAEGSDQRVVIAKSLLRVETRDETSGEDKTADQASQAFAKHLTDNLDAYAADPGLTVFSRLQAHAVLFAIVGKLHGEVVAKSGETKTTTIHRNRHIPAWLAAGHRVQKVNTPLATKTLRREERHTNSNQTITVHQIVGGVRLDADHPQVWVNSPVADLKQELEQQMQAAPQSHSWRWTARGQSYGAVRLGQIAEFKAWHQDFNRNDLQLVRETVPSYELNREFGVDWQLRMPRLQLSHETALLSKTEHRPAYMRVENGLGETVYLSEFGIRGIVGGPEANTFTSRDGKRGAFFAKDGFIYYEGDVQLRDQGGLTVVAQPGARIINFVRTPGDTGHELSAAAKYRVDQVRAGVGQPAIEYRYDEKSRLSSIATSPQQTIQLKYNEKGRITRAEFSDNRVARNYLYDARDRLTNIFDDRGERLGYRYDADDGRLIAIGARLSGPAEVTGQLVVEDQNRARSEVRPSSDAVQLVNVVADTSRTYKIHVNNQEKVIESLPLQPGELEGSTSNQLKSSYKDRLQALLTSRTKFILVSGGMVERHQLAELVSSVEPDKVVVATKNLESASQKLNPDETGIAHNNRARVIFEEALVADVPLKDGVGQLRQALRSAADRLNDPAASVVILPGHRDHRYLDHLTSLYNNGALTQKCVILLTCTTADPISDAGVVEAMLSDGQGGATTISRSPRLIDQQLMPEVIERIETSLQKLGPQTSAGEILQAINEAIRGLGRVELHHQSQTEPRMAPQLDFRLWGRSPSLFSLAA